MTRDRTGVLIRRMATHQDIVDYYRIDRLNGNSNTRSMAAVALYRFVRNLLRFMSWPEDSSAKFGRFIGGEDNAKTQMTFTVEGRSFTVDFGFCYNGPKVDNTTTCQSDILPWQLTIETNPPLLYEPAKQETLAAVYEQASATILRRALAGH